MNNLTNEPELTAAEYWKYKFDEYPQNNSEKLSVAMMNNYAEIISKGYARFTNKYWLDEVTGIWTNSSNAREKHTEKELLSIYLKTLNTQR